MLASSSAYDYVTYEHISIISIDSTYSISLVSVKNQWRVIIEAAKDLKVFFLSQRRRIR
jgi:hypothetical protein